MAGDSRNVLLASVIGAQGLSGAVKVKVFTASAESLARYGLLHSNDGRTFTVTSVRAAKGDEAVLHLAEVSDRTTAEALRGVELYVRRDALPAPAQEEYYHADLIGLEAVLGDGTPVGRVRAIHDFGAGDTLELARPGAQPVMVPFTRAVVPAVELAKGQLVLDPPPGLLDDGRR